MVVRGGSVHLRRSASGLPCEWSRRPLIVDPVWPSTCHDAVVGGRRRTWVAGTPIPTPDRAGAGLAVVDGSAWVLVDCGRAVTQRALQAGLDLTALVSFASRIITLTTSAISPPWRRPAGPPARRRRWRPSGRRPGRPNVASASLTSPSMLRRAAVPGIARPSPSTRSLRLRPPPPLPLGMAG